MRAQRLESMKQEHKKRQEWLANGTKRISLIISKFFLSRSW